MTFKRSSTPLLAALLVAACSGGDLEETTTIVKEELVGGRPALEAEYPAAVRLVFGTWCTGAKVGPRHFLLAAHCLYNHGSGTNTLQPGQQLEVITDNGSGPGRRFSVAAVHVHPNWIAGNGSLDPSFPPDVGLVVVNEHSPDIREAAVDAATVTPGQSVVLTGYGCENGLGQPTPPPRLKIEETPALDESALLHPNSFVPTPEQAADVAASNVITAGFFADPGAASLCPGDSGGALFRELATEQLAVGVNAYYTFTPQGNPVSTTNWHARLDAASRYGVLDWLAARGVSVRSTGTCKDGVKNGPEPAADCGASCAAACSNGSACRTDSDCSSQNCDNGTCQAPRPCSGLCSEPTVFSSLPFDSTAVGTRVGCYETTANVGDILCGSMSGRSFEVNGAALSCSSPFVPAPRNGGYCFRVDAGTPSWSWFSAW